jgi:hypothetical protein
LKTEADQKNGKKAETSKEGAAQGEEKKTEA